MSARRNARCLSVVAETTESAYLPPSMSIAGAEPKTCLLCYGSGWEFHPEKGARPCGCRAEGGRDRLLRSANLPRRYNECRLSNYRLDKSNGTQLRAFGYAHRIVENYPALDRGLLFMGPCGIGKTHLSVAILHGLIEKGVPCLFYDFGSLLKEIQKSYNTISQTSEMEVLAPVYEAEVLVLDELGASKPTEWVCDTLRQIIGRRYNDRKLTILTTNYTDTPGDSRHETLEDRIGARLRSRLFEMCKTVVMEGEDYRRQFDAESL